MKVISVIKKIYAAILNTSLNSTSVSEKAASLVEHSVSTNDRLNQISGRLANVASQMEVIAARIEEATSVSEKSASLVEHSAFTNDRLNQMSGRLTNVASLMEVIAARIENTNNSRKTDFEEPALTELRAIRSALQEIRDKQSFWSETGPLSPHAIFNDLIASARQRSLQIIETEMASAVTVLDWPEFLRFSLDQAPADGAHCEFGVWSGDTITVLAHHRPYVQFDGFDSFEGLPGEWGGYTRFDFNRNRELPQVPANVRLHTGLFDDTLPGYVKTIDKVAFLHVDCDLYASTKSIFDLLGKKLAKGCVIVFDEYFCYPGFEQHEYKAFQEFLARSKRKPQWIAISGQRAACILD